MCSLLTPQNTKVTIMDQGATTTSFPMALHHHRLNLQLTPPTSWALVPERWRVQATTHQMTKGSRT